MATIQLGNAIQRGVIASRPASGDATKAGQLYYATDEGILYHDDGTSWAEVANFAAILGAIAALSATGLIARTGSGTVAARTLAAGSAKLAVTNGSGAAGNPTVDLGSVALDDLSDGSTAYRSGGTDVAIADGGTGASSASAARTALGLAIGTDVEAHDADLTAIAGLSPSNDDVLQRKAGAWANRTIAQLIADIIAAGAWTEAVQDVIGAMIAAAGGSYNDAAGTITLPGGGGSLTVEEADGSPTDSAVTKLVFPNGTLSIVSHVATYTPAGGGSGLTELGYVESTDTTDRTNSSGTLTDVNAMSLTITCPATAIMIELQINCYNSSANQRHHFCVYDVTGSAVVATQVLAPHTNDQTYLIRFRFTPAATGSRTYKIQTRSNDGATLHYRAFPSAGSAGVSPYSLRAIG